MGRHSNDAYKNETESLLRKVENYAKNTKPEKEQRRYIEDGGWKGRMGGRGLVGGNRVTEVIDEDKIVFHFSQRTENWLEVCKVLGKIVEKSGDIYTQIINHQSLQISTDK